MKFEMRWMVRLGETILMVQTGLHGWRVRYGKHALRGQDHTISIRVWLLGLVKVELWRHTSDGGQ